MATIRSLRHCFIYCSKNLPHVLTEIWMNAWTTIIIVIIIMTYAHTHAHAHHGRGGGRNGTAATLRLRTPPLRQLPQWSFPAPAYHSTICNMP